MRRKYAEPQTVVIHVEPHQMLVRSTEEDNNADAKRQFYYDEEEETTIPLKNFDPWESGL